jgi:membrane protease YdiL (CAAX protease family)
VNLDFSKIVLIRVDLFKKNSDFSRSGSGALSVLVLLLGLMHALYPRAFRRRSALVNYVYHKDAYVYGGIVSWMRSYSGSIVMASRLAGILNSIGLKYIEIEKGVTWC